MALRVATSAAIVGVAAGTINLSISDCGDSATHGHVNSVSPASVEQGKKTLVSASGNLDTTVADGSFTVEVKAAGVTVQTCKGDVCGASSCALPANTGSVDFHGLACPVAAGDVSLDFDVSISEFVPSSLTTLELDISAEGSGGKLLCAKINTSPALAASGMSWEEYKMQYGKTYNGQEEDARRAQFEINSQHIAEHNAKGSSLQLGFNQFTDLTQDEYRVAAGLGYKPSARRMGSMPHLGVHTYNGEQLAETVDWTTQGAVTPVKDQGQCGSCWAFSTTGGLEGAWQIASGSLKSLSEQQFVDCDTATSAGCQGGDMATAFEWAESQSLATEDSYPYTATDGSCKSSFTTAIPSGGVSGYKSVDQSTEALKSAINVGPVSVAIEADQIAFQLYSGGILENTGGLFGSCGTNLDHGVLAVGYGSNYFKVKNSWGASWGENGYLQISTDGNTCGIHSDAVYPTVSASVSV